MPLLQGRPPRTVTWHLACGRASLEESVRPQGVRFTEVCARKPPNQHGPRVGRVARSSACSAAVDTPSPSAVVQGDIDCPERRNGEAACRRIALAGGLEGLPHAQAGKSRSTALRQCSSAAWT